MKTLNDWLNEGRKTESFGFSFTKRVICADGFNISIQSSDGHYCTPRRNDDTVENYTAFELGFPSESDELINEFAEDDNYTEAVYPYTPREIVQQLIDKHGGITGFMNKPSK